MPTSILKSATMNSISIPFEGVCNELRTGKGTGGWCGCFVGFPVINMPRMMPCVSTIPPKPSDRIHHRSFLSLSLSYPHQFPPRANLSPSPSLPFRFSSSPSPFMGIHRSHKKFDTFPVAWHGCVLDWASPRWCFPLPPSRNSRPRGEKRRLSLPRFASMDSHRNQGNWFFFTFIFIIPLPVLFMTYDRPFLNYALAIDHHRVRISSAGNRWFFFFNLK